MRRRLRGIDPGFYRLAGPAKNVRAVRIAAIPPSPPIYSRLDSLTKRPYPYLPACQSALRGCEDVLRPSQVSILASLAWTFLPQFGRLLSNSLPKPPYLKTPQLSVSPKDVWKVSTGLSKRGSFVHFSKSLVVAQRTGIFSQLQQTPYGPQFQGRVGQPLNLRIPYPLSFPVTDATLTGIPLPPQQIARLESQSREEQTSVSWFYEIRSSTNTLLKRDGGFASQDAAKMAAREDAKKMKNMRRVGQPLRRF
jgi:hypothetical protein